MVCVNILLNIEPLCIVLEQCDRLVAQLFTFSVFSLQHALSYTYRTYTSQAIDSMLQETRNEHRLTHRLTLI